MTPDRVELRRLAQTCRVGDEFYQHADVTVLDLLDALDAAEARIAGIVADLRELHTPLFVELTLSRRCGTCGDEWPCPTVALAEKWLGT